MTTPPARPVLNDRSESLSARKLRSQLEEIFGLDLRSLALFRISLAAFVIGDVAFRLPHLVPLYAERGLLSSDAALQVIGPGLYFSLHFWLRSSVEALAILFGLQLLVALAMLVGYRTRIATAATWYLLASLQVAETYHLHLGGDTYIRMMLLWGALLPLGKVWSLDARRDRESGAPKPPTRTYSWVSFALVSQFLLFYLVAGLCKNTPIWNEGQAVYYMLHRDHLATMFTPMLLEQRWALTPLTYGTYWFEVLGPLLLVFPFRTAVVRMLAIAMFIGFHLGLGIFLDIGPYPLMALAPFPALLPTRFWQEWWPRLRGRPPNLQPSGGPPIGAPRLIQALACGIVFYSLVYQLQESNFVRLPKPLVAAGGALRINQSYRMMRDIGTRSFWLVVDGRTVAGQAVDPFQQAPLSLAKPADIPATFRSFRFRQFILGSVAHVASDSRRRTLHHAFAEYLCQEWNAEHTGAERLASTTTIRGYQTTTLEGVGAPEYAVLWEHECGAPLSQDAAFSSTRQRIGQTGQSPTGRARPFDR